MNHASKMRDALVKFKTGAQMRLDTWTNPATGFGTGRDKTEYGFVLPNRILTDIELSALYHSDDMAARMIDVIPNEMLREGFSFETGDTDLDSALSAKFDEIAAPEKFVEGIKWGRCFGGAGLLIGADDGQDAEQPLVPERAKDLTFLYAIDRRMLWPLSFYEDTGNPKLGQPKTYLVTTMGGTSFDTKVCHESRLILFRGASTGIRERQQLFGWDLSVMQRAYDVLRSFNTGWKAVETLLTDGNQAIFKMTGLAEMLASGGEEILRTRMAAMDTYRSVMRALVIDADGKEEFERNSANFANIPDTLDKFMLRLSAAVQIPVTILMGQSPAGMNSTGDSDFRWFYDRIRAEQNTVLAPKIRRLVNVWIRTQAGQKYQAAAKASKALNIKFPNLWSDTPLVVAQRRLAIAQGDDVYVQNQGISPEEVALQRFQPDGFDKELILTDEGKAAREATMNAAHAAQTPQLDKDGNPIPPGTPLDEDGQPIAPEDQQPQMGPDGQPIPAQLGAAPAPGAAPGAPGAAPGAAPAPAAPGAPGAAPGAAPAPPMKTAPGPGAPGAKGPDGKPIPATPQTPIGAGLAGAPAGGPPGTGGQVGQLKLTATDIAVIITANEARASVGLPPLPGEDGKLTLPQFKAKYATAIAAAINAEDGTLDDGTNQPHEATEGAREKKKEPIPPGLAAHIAGGGAAALDEDGKPIKGAPPKGVNPFAKGDPNADPNAPPAKGKKPPPAFLKKKGNLDSDDHVDLAHHYTARAKLSADRFDYSAAVNNMAAATDHAFSASIIKVETRYDGMRTFEMHRDEDETGVSGTGHVADGVQFEDGKVAMRWRGKTPGTTFFDNMDHLNTVHGHGGKTRIVFHPNIQGAGGIISGSPGTVARVDFDPDQPRVPAGSPDGGEFGSGGGGGASGGSSGSGGSSPSAGSGGGTTTAGEGKGTLYGKGAVGKHMGDPFGHPPPSDDPKNYKPDPTSTKGSDDKVTAAARVGIPGKEAPPPFVVPRLANLSPEERAVEKRFADAFEKEPQRFIDAYRQQVYGATKKDGSPDEEARKTFGTDNCKNLSHDYAANAENKALYNIAVHQTANLIAKAAFEQHMAEHVAKLPEDQRHVLVTAGGCAAGKGFALQNAPTEEVKGALGKAAAVWDTAGEQNSTELGWVQKHTEAAGGSAHYVFVDADPKVAFDRVVSRAVGDPAKGKAGEGRVVDKLLFAESYAIGAKNFKAFADKNKDNPRAAVTYINVRQPPPSISDGISKDAQNATVKEVHEAAKDYIAKNEARLSPAVKAGATASDHIWGAQ